MNDSATISAIAIAILNGLVLSAETATERYVDRGETVDLEPGDPIVSTVGPVSAAIGPTEYRCLSWPGGAPVEQKQAVPHIFNGLDHDYEDDGSAFAAAKAFVERHGVEDALAALAAVEQKAAARRDPEQLALKVAS